MATENNIIPLYINSIDRVSINDSTTNFTIALRKSLRNVHSLSVGKVVIPRSATMINSNNQTINGIFASSNVSTEFSITITKGTYTETSLASELNSKFNANIISSLFGLIWTISYDAVSERITINLFYPDGPLFEWAVVFDYTELINVSGIGSPGTIPQKFSASFTDQLNIPCSRKPTLTNPLLYSITSNEFTQSINTSYIRSLAKNFNISSTNNTIKIDANFTAVNINQPIPLGTETLPTFLKPTIIAMSADSNIIACSADFSGFLVFAKSPGGSFWVQRINQITNGFDGGSLALSSDGNTLAVGSPFIDSSKGLTSVYIRIGYSWVLQAEILSTGTIGFANQGTALALSADGNTLAIGGPSDNLNIGATWIWVRSGLVWSQQAKLIGSIGLSGSSEQGSSVALSASGNTVVIGAPSNNLLQGCIYVFKRSGIVWTENNQYIGSGAIGQAQQGTKVAISDSGNTIALSGTHDNSSIGAVWIFEYTGPNWVQQAKIIGSGFTGPTVEQGSSIAFANSGDKIAIGGYRNNSDIGAVWIHTRSGSVWTQQQFIVSSRTSFTNQGAGVAMSSDGLTLAIGGLLPNLILGAIDIFTGSIFAPYQSLTSTGSVAKSAQGSSVAISTNGNIMAVGGPSDNDSVGAVWMYERKGLEWVQLQKIVGNSNVGQSQQGSSVALSGDGSTVAIGAIGDDSFIGATWIFKRQSDGIWYQLQKLVATSSANAQQGSSVALSDKYLAVGSSGESAGIGAVFIFKFENNTFTEQQKLVGSFPGDPAGRGNSVAISGETVAFGGQQYNGQNGLVWIFKFNSGLNQWIESQTLAGSNPIGTSQQGSGISLSGDGKTLAVGGFADNSDVGAVWMFNLVSGSFVEDKKIIESTRYLGFSVSLNYDGTKMIIGAGGDSVNVGAVYTYKKNNNIWETGKRFVANNFASLGFGFSVSSSGNGEFSVGAGSTGINIGRVSYIIDSSQLDGNFDILVADGTYTIFDFETSLTRQIDNYISFNAVFDGVSVFSLTGILSANITSFIFSVSNSSTFDAIIWPSLTKLIQQSTEVIDFTINNNVMKLVLNQDTNLITNTYATNDIFRKYPPGFTIDAGKLIDIQLRDERDRIVDLNGLNWFIEILATIYS